jgi:CubicO group peptidase (beta-lactamase class C family)
MLSLACFVLAVPNPSIQRLVQSQAAYYNVSLSFGASLSDGRILAGASGPSDRITGATTTTDSLYPSGSVTKTFSAVAALRLVDQGKLNLDAPFHTIVDPWLSKQGKSSLRVMWGGSKTIEAVTVRHLLQMRSGVADYDDREVKAWTLEHPTADYLPDDYVSNASKQFLFTPGTGGSYTGVGYVLLGWTLCAATDGCRTWSDFDLKKAAGVSSMLKDTRFMGAGPCSQYKNVVHQYLYSPYRQSLSTAQPLVESADGPSQRMSRHEAELDTSVELFPTASQRADESETLKLGDFVDLYELSCLNGWTMGNIATNPSELMRFYHEVFIGDELLSPAAKSQMVDFKPLTTGFATGTPYGFGLMMTHISLPLRGVSSCNGLPGCKCSHSRCHFEDYQIGHAGLDYGSGVPRIGHMPSLNISYAIAINVGEEPIGMNSTLSSLQNYQGVLSFQCALLDAVIHEQLPDYPEFECY